MSRGGYFAIRPAVVLQADGWADLSCSELGAWVRLRASAELTELPVSERAAERLGVTLADLEALRSAGLLDEAPDGVLAVGMPGPAKNPSDEPERVRARVAAHRAAHPAPSKGERKPLHPKKETTPVHSIPFQSNEVTPLQVVTSPERLETDTRETVSMREESEPVTRLEPTSNDGDRFAVPECRDPREHSGRYYFDASGRPSCKYCTPKVAAVR